MCDRKCLILGSASPRRAKILHGLGIEFEVVPPGVQEVFAEHRPQWTVEENASRKNRWCRRRHAGRDVLTADTVVVFEGRCLTKPRSREEAKAFLRMFSGRAQDILTGVAYAEAGWRERVEVVRSSVTFRKLDDATIETYFKAVDPMDKAGAYDIDQHGDLIIQSHSGSRTNIMGLPAELVGNWLARRHARAGSEA